MSPRAAPLLGQRDAWYLLRYAVLLVLLLCSGRQAAMAADFRSQSMAGSTLHCVVDLASTISSQAPEYPQLSTCPLFEAALAPPTVHDPVAPAETAGSPIGVHPSSAPAVGTTLSRPGPAPPNRTRQALLQVFLN